MDKLRIALIIGYLLININSAFGATIEYEADYLGTITQINLPAKDIKIVLLDLRQLITEPFGSYITNNNIAIKNYAVAKMRISTEEILGFFTFDTLAQIKQKSVDYAATHNVTLSWKQHQPGQNVSQWWNKATTN